LAGEIDGLIIPDSTICQLTNQQLCSDGDNEGQIEWPAYLGLLNNQ
jgi:hypothetical protein